MAPGGGRLAIIAGNGRLPLHIAAAARRAGEDPLVFRLDGEADQDWTGFEEVPLSIADVAGFSAFVRKAGIDRVVLSGGIARRPDWRSIRPTWRMLRILPEVVRALASYGDDRMLRVAIRLLEGEGVKVVGAQAIAPDLLATTGPLGRHAPDEAARRDIAAASAAALALGDLDIGQGAVAVRGRVVALEGLEGTDGMLRRVAELRASGRLANGTGGVLVKLCKPTQDLRADLPSVGPLTVASARAAGLAGIAVEAGRSLVLDRAQMIADADAAGLFIVGIDPEAL